MNRVLIINKPIGFTSQDVVSKVKKILNEKKAGHTGTLDPMATGVLPILLGNTTKLSKYLIEHDKTYEATIMLGEKKDTGDSEGSCIEKKVGPEECVKKEIVEKVLQSFKGKQEQTPPMYSAIKVNGKKLYEYAREGKEIEIPKRTIEIYNIELKEINEKEKTISFKVECSKGTYIRTLCEDISKKLGTIGYMSKLCRTKVNEFEIESAITIEKLEEEKENKLWLEENSFSMEEILKDLPKIELNARKKELLLNGVQLTWEKEDGIYNLYFQNKYLGTGTIKNQLLKRDIIEENI